MAFFISGVGQAATKARRTRRSILDRVPAGFLDARLPSPLAAAQGRRRRPPVSRPVRSIAGPHPALRTPVVRPATSAIGQELHAAAPRAHQASLGEPKPAADIGATSRRALDTQLQSLLQFSAQGRISQRQFKAEVRRARKAALRFL